MEVYFEHLINAAYRAYQDILIKKYGDIYPLRSAVIKFGGFHLSYDWYGRTRLGKEENWQLNYLHQRNSFEYSFCLLLRRIKKWYS